MVAEAVQPKEWNLFRIFSCLDGLQSGCAWCQSQLCIIPAAFWDVAVLGCGTPLPRFMSSSIWRFLNLSCALCQSQHLKAPCHSACPCLPVVPCLQ